MAICTECSETQPAWVMDDEVVPVGTDGCCSCGAGTFEVMGFEDGPPEPAGGDAEAT